MEQGLGRAPAPIPPPNGTDFRRVPLTGTPQVLLPALPLTSRKCRDSPESFSKPAAGPERPNVAFGAFNAPKAALGAFNATKATLGRWDQRVKVRVPSAATRGASSGSVSASARASANAVSCVGRASVRRAWPAGVTSV
jgi:hypothetical protein